MAQSLTPEQRKTFEEVFSIFDERGQGKIKTTDFKNVLLCLGMELTNKELEDIINEIDRDGSGSVQLSEFLEFMSRGMEESEAARQGLRDDYKEVFKIMDVDGDGWISERDVAIVMGKLGEKMKVRDVKGMIEVADQQGAGRVLTNDFVKVIEEETQETKSTVKRNL